jgi:hypothetical protein
MVVVLICKLRLPTSRSSRVSEPMVEEREPWRVEGDGERWVS